MQHLYYLQRRCLWDKYTLFTYTYRHWMEVLIASHISKYIQDEWEQQFNVIQNVESVPRGQRKREHSHPLAPGSPQDHRIESPWAFDNEITSKITNLIFQILAQLICESYFISQASDNSSHWQLAYGRKEYVICTRHGKKNDFNLRRFYIDGVAMAF